MTIIELIDNLPDEIKENVDNNIEEKSPDDNENTEYIEEVINQELN